MDALLADRMLRITDKLQTLLHAVDTVLTLAYGGVAGQNPADAVPGGVDLLDGEGGENFVLHSLSAIDLVAALGGQQHLGRRQLNLGNRIQIDQILAIEILQRQRFIKTAVK